MYSFILKQDIASLLFPSSETWEKQIAYTVAIHILYTVFILDTVLKVSCSPFGVLFTSHIDLMNENF